MVVLALLGVGGPVGSVCGLGVCRGRSRRLVVVSWLAGVKVSCGVSGCVEKYAYVGDVGKADRVGKGGLGSSCLKVV